MAPPRWVARALDRARRLGLRSRITIAFALGGLLLSIIVGGVTWTLTRESQLSERITAAENRVVRNAIQVQNGLAEDLAGVDDLLNGLPKPQGGIPILLVDDRVFTTDALEVGDPTETLPAELQTSVGDGVAARMVHKTAGGDTVVSIGVPLEVTGSQYYERVPLNELDNNLRLLAISLTGAGIITTLAGAAIGAWASRRTLRPLADVSEAARAIAEGQLETRLDDTSDADLELLVLSFNQMASALEERIDRDARFASEVSHELRSPVMTLTASIEVLRNSVDEFPERAQTALSLLTADLDRFQQLVEDLLEISRFDAGAAHLRLEPVFLTEVVRAAVGVSSDHPVRIDVDESVEELVINVDKRRIVQIMANLLGNAEKYGEGASRVHLGRDDDHAFIVVEDDGPGIPDDELDRIFDRFSRGTEGGNRGADTGVGLGLSLVAEHVALHGGAVWAESKPSGEPGGRFVVALPLPHPDELAHLEQHDEVMA
ncbi:MAG: ATP-binding protein [Acidimicrobiales bacterium]